MRAVAEKGKGQPPAKVRLLAASSYALEVMESRVLLSSTIASWSFTAVEPASSSLVTLTAGSAPAGVTITNGQNTGNPTLAAIGMTESGGTSANNIDIASTPGTAHAAFTENTWRIRGNGAGNNGDTNGWWLQAPQYTQGAEIDLNTSGYSSLNNLTFDWYCTSSGVKDMMVQYNTNTTNSATWTNLLSTPLVATSNDYYGAASASPTNSVDLSGISGAANDANFGIRLVSAYDPNFPASTQYSAATSTSATQTPITNTSGNWRFANVAVTGTTTPKPSVSSVTVSPASINPNQTISLSAVVTETGGTPSSVSFYREAANGTENTAVDTLIPGAATNSSGTWTLSNVATTGLAPGTYTYYAVATDSTNATNSGFGTSPSATLTVVGAAPVITTQPASLYVAAGTANVTFTAAATGNPLPNVQWYMNTPSNATFMPISGATSTTYTIPAATEGLSGDKYEAIFTNSTSTATTNAATLTVTGSPITQWNFTGGIAPSPGGGGAGNMPPASLQGSSTDLASTLGLSNDYAGVQSFPEADVLPIRSVVNTGFNEYIWRVRGGGGGGPTGTPGTPNGWSQNAPEYANGVNTNLVQGVQFAVNTAGYSNITLHFDWAQGNIADMQAQYSPDGGQTWTNVGTAIQGNIAPAIQANGGDYYGITSGALSATNPTGVLVNLQGISAANNQSNFQIRLISAYDPGLPNITDGNLLDPTVHGQYAASFGAANAQQVLTLGSSTSFNLTFNGHTSGVINVTTGTSSATLAANSSAIQAALAALTGVGAANIAVAATDATGTRYTITFKGTLGSLPQPLITSNDASAAIATWQVGTPTISATTTTTAPFTVTAQSPLTLTVVSTAGFNVGGTVKVGGITSLITAVAAPAGTITVTPETSGAVASGATINQLGVSRYTDGSGSFEIGNISINGDTTTGAPGIVSPPASETVAGGYGASFTATAYSESTPTVQWQVNNGSGTFTNVSGGTVTPTTFTNNPSGSYTSTYSFTTDSNLDQNTYQYRAVFTNGNGSTNSAPATLTVVAPTAPTVTTQPSSLSVQAGNVAVFSAAASANPAATVQWQINAGTGFTNLVDGTTVSGSQTTTLRFTTSSTSQNNDQFRAVFFNAVAPSGVPSNAAALTVLATETVLTAWDFSSHSQTNDNNPPPVPAGIDGSINVGGVANAVGMTLPYNPNDFATGTDGNGAVNSDDVTNSPGALNPNFTENTWRIRAGINAATGGTPANGWSNLVSQYTQGAQFTAPTTGYQNIYATLDWYSTTSGELDAQPQYTVSSKKAAITSISVSTNQQATLDSVTLTGNNTFAAGDSVTVTGLIGAYASLNGVYTLTAATGTSFSFYVNTTGITSISNDPVTATATDSVWVNLGPQVTAVSNDFYGATAGTGLTNISSVSLTSNVATLSAPNSYTVGQTVNVAGVTPAFFNGTFKITAATSTTFSYALTGADLAATPQTGGAASANIGGLPVPLVFDVSKIPLAVNNPNFGIRLVNAYNPTLSNTQALRLNDTSNFQLTFNGQTTATIAWSSTPATLQANIAAALGALPNVGAANVSVVGALAGSGTTGGVYYVTFTNALNTIAQPAIVPVDSADTVTTNYQYANAALVGSPAGPAPYNGSKGNWRFDNIQVHGAPLVTFNAPPTTITAIKATSTSLTTGGFTDIGGASATGTGTQKQFQVYEFDSPQNRVFASPTQITSLSSLSFNLYDNGESATGSFAASAGKFDVYLIPAPVTGTGSVATSTLRFNADATGLIGQAGLTSANASSYLLGTVDFSTPPTTAGALPFTLNPSLPSSTATALITALNAGTAVRIAVVPDTATTGAGNIQSNFNGTVAPTLSVTTATSPTAEAFTLSSPTYTVNENDAGASAVFSVTRTGDTSDAATVAYATTAGTALAGTNYGASGVASEVTGTATFAKGASVATFSIPVLNAPTQGGNKTFSVTLTSPASPNGDTTTLGTQASAVATIVDAAPLTNNQTGVAKSVTDVEPSGNFATSFAPLVGDTTAGTGSFNFLGYEVLEFSSATTPGLYPALGQQVKTDGTGLSNLSLQLYNTNNTAGSNYNGHAGNFNVYFVNDSTATTATSSLKFLFNDPTGTIGNTPSISPTGTFTTAGAPTLLGTFSFNDALGYDTYTPASIPTAVQTSIVTALNSYSNFRLLVTPQTSGPGAVAADLAGVFSGETPTLSLTTGTTTNKQAEFINFTNPTYSVSETAGAASISLTRTGSTTDQTTVTYATSDGSAIAGANYTASTGTATFLAGSSTATFTIPVTNAANQGGDKALTLTLTNPVAGSSSTNVAGLGSTGFATSLTAPLTITDSSTAPTSTLAPALTDASDVEANGPFNDTQIKATAVSGNFPSYGVIDFKGSVPATPVTGIDSITLSVTNEPTATAGKVNFYLVQDATSNVIAASPQARNPHFYDSAQGTEGLDKTPLPTADTNSFGTAMLLGVYNYTDANGGDVLSVPLANYSLATQSALIRLLNGGSQFRIVVTPEDSTVNANWIAVATTISIKVQQGTAGTPAVSSFSASPTPVVTGSFVTLAATVSDTGATVAGVNFYRESNGTSGLQIGGDTLVGGSTLSGSTWTLANVPTAGLAAGAYTYYAVVSDSTGATAIATTPLTVTGSQLLAWNLFGQGGGTNLFGASPLTDTVTDPSVTNSAPLTRGSGISTTGTGASNAWGGTGFSITANTAAAAVTANQFATFGFTVGTGYTDSLSSISLNYRRSATGPANGEVQYAIGAGAFNAVTGYSETNLFGSSTSLTGTVPPISLSGTSALQGLAAGTVVTFRIVPYGATNAGGTWYINDGGNNQPTDLIVNGTVVSPLPAGVTASPGAVYAYNSTANTLSLTSGTLTFSQDVGSAASLTLKVSADGAGSAMVFNSTEHLNSLTLTNGAKATLSQSGTDTVTGGALVNYGTTLSQANTKVLVLNILSIPVAGAALTGGGTNGAQGTLDLTNNAMIMNYAAGSNAAALAAADGLLGSGSDGAVWDGTGITSSNAQADNNNNGYTAIGAADNGDLGYNTFAGENVSSGNQMLFMYTYNGDSDLNGILNVTDTISYEQGLATHPGGPAGTGWEYGSLDYGATGQGSLSDLQLLEAGFRGYKSSGVININEN